MCGGYICTVMIVTKKFLIDWRKILNGMDGIDKKGMWCKLWMSEEFGKERLTFMKLRLNGLGMGDEARHGCGNPIQF